MVYKLVSDWTSKADARNQAREIVVMKYNYNHNELVKYYTTSYGIMREIYQIAGMEATKRDFYSIVEA